MDKTVVVMRGLPWCGKSYTAKQIAGDIGVIFSTDDYFYQVVDAHKPNEYNFVGRFLAYAHKWNQVRFQLAVNENHPLVIVDNTNTTGSEARAYVEYALNQDYKIQIQEPTSDRWLQVRELLKDKKTNKNALKDFAKVLEAGSRETHNVPFHAIERMMFRWEFDLTVEQILQSPKLKQD